MDDDPTARPPDGVRISLPGEVLILDLDILPAHDRALRAQTHWRMLPDGAERGWRVPTLVASVVGGIGKPELAAIIFLARRQTGGGLSYDQIESALPASGDVVVEFGLLDDFQESDSPEA